MSAPLAVLLQPFAVGLRRRLLADGRRLPARTVTMGLVAAAVAVGLYWGSLRVFSYFQAQNELGIILNLKIFQMAWLLLFAMQLFSSTTAALGGVFLAADNEIVVAAPVRPATLFAMRLVTTTAYTGWMVVAFGLPIFCAFGMVFQAVFWYWPLLLATLVATVLTAATSGCLLAVVLVRVFPARRTKDIVTYLSLLFGTTLYLLFRLLRPEELVNPEQFGRFIEYLAAISTPAGPWVPGGWAANLLGSCLLDQRFDGLLAGVLFLAPVPLYVVGEWAMERWFLVAWTRAQESFGGHRRFRPAKQPAGPLAALWRKEGKSFLRDANEWSQLFMITALVVVYLYNFKMLPVERSPMETEAITNLIAFANIGLAGFVIVALAARFVYPAVGGEGGAFPLLRAAPLTMGRFLLAKYLFYGVPFALLNLVLVALTDHLLQVAGPIWPVSIFCGQVVTWSVVALALWFGSRWADFRAPDRSAVLGSFGAVAFLLASGCFTLVVIVAAAPVTYRLVRNWRYHQAVAGPDLLLAGLVGLLLAGAATAVVVLSLRNGSRSLEGG